MANAFAKVATWGAKARLLSVAAIIVNELRKADRRTAKIEEGMSGDSPMLIWLGKAILQQTDKIEVKKIDFSELTDEEIEQIMCALEGSEDEGTEGGDDE